VVAVVVMLLLVAVPVVDLPAVAEGGRTGRGVVIALPGRLISFAVCRRLDLLSISDYLR